MSFQCGVTCRSGGNYYFCGNKNVTQMDTPFAFDVEVTDKQSYGHKAEIAALARLAGGGRSVAIYEPPKTGVSSVLKQTLLDMTADDPDIEYRELSLLNVRTSDELLDALGAPAGSGEEALADAFAAPYIRAIRDGRRNIVVLNDFHNITNLPDWENICRILNGTIGGRGEGDSRASYIFTGSRVNAMDEIFGRRKLFFRNVDRLEILPVPEKDIVESVIRGYLNSGKVIDRDLLYAACAMLGCNLWYINQLATLCDYLSKGYIMEYTMREAFAALIAVHEPRFKAMMEDLTTFQTNLLRAILEGHDKFSSADVISGYGLNSSANVLRLKDALRKKEIVRMDTDTISVEDPLFAYWARKYFFRMKIEGDLLP